MVALTKHWDGNDTGNVGDWSTADNWLPVALGASAFRWTESSAQSGEYYLELAAGGDPSIAQPGSVYAGGAAMSAGTVGSLAVGEYAYDNNDSLGFNTIYVRVAGTVDPDSLAADYVTATLVPVSGDHAVLPPGAADITAGLDQTAVTLGSLVSLPGYTGQVGNTDGAFPVYLRIKAARFVHSGTGLAYVNLLDSNIPAEVRNAGPGTAGTHGLYLLGSNLTIVSVDQGNVGVAARPGETATVATLRNEAGNVTVGAGVTLANVDVGGGQTVIRCAVTSVLDQYNGECRTEDQGAIAAWNVEGGLAVPNSVGALTAMNLNGGEADFTQSQQARTVGTLTIGDRAARRLKLDPDVVTVTTFALPGVRFDARFSLAT